MSERKRIYLCLAHMSEAGLEQKYIKEAFDTNWVVPLGPNVNGFEKDLEDFVCHTDSPDNTDLKKRVVALSSGTSAVHLALIACGVKAGDEVLVQSFTFCASSHPITYLGATPVFIDSEKDTWNMDPELLEEAIRDRIAKTGKKPKAIVPVALYGMPYKIDRIMEIANKYDIPVIEDAAEGFGSRYNGQVLGTMDQAGVEARPLWKPMHKQPVYKNCPAYVNGVSEAIFKIGMCLPAGPYVKEDDVKYIVDSIKAAIVG